MPSPFPGMDPYLECPKLWPSFQHHLVTSLLQVLQSSLESRYRTRTFSRTYCSETPLFTSIIRENHVEEVGEIRNKSDGRLITLIEVVSPANKTTAAGRTCYLEKRREAFSQRAGIVEIDLVLQGKPTLSYSRESLPEFDYAVTVTRAATPERYEIYTTVLSKRLPKFKLPLAQDDRDALIDLQTAFTRAYDVGGFAAHIDYSTSPPADVPLTDDKQNWIREHLKVAKLQGVGK